MLSEEIVFSRVAEERTEGCIAIGTKQLHMLSDLVIEGNYDELRMGQVEGMIQDSIR